MFYVSNFNIYKKDSFYYQYYIEKQTKNTFKSQTNSTIRLNLLPNLKNELNFNLITIFFKSSLLFFTFESKSTTLTNGRNPKTI